LPEPGEESLFFDSGAPRPVVDSQVAAELFESAGLSAGLPGEVTTASVPTWNVMNQVCYARLTVDGTYTDACAVSYKLTNDTSQNFNFWGMRMYSTSGVLNPAFRLTRALIQARESAAGP